MKFYLVTAGCGGECDALRDNRQTGHMLDVAILEVIPGRHRMNAALRASFAASRHVRGKVDTLQSPQKCVGRSGRVSRCADHEEESNAREGVSLSRTWFTFHYGGTCLHTFDKFRRRSLDI